MRRRAFTLIEMMVVCTVLMIVAALVVPNVVAMKAGQEREEAYRSVLRLAQQGREGAIRDGRAYTLSLQDNGQRLVLDREKAKDPDADPRQTNLLSPNDAETEEVASVSLPSDVSSGNVTLDGKSSSASDFTLHFYPDGRSEGGGVEWTEGNTTRSLLVTTDGLSTLTEGRLPDTTESRWEAGTYEQRTTGS